MSFTRDSLPPAWWRRAPLTREGFFWLLIALAMLVTGLIKAINLLNLLACWLLMLLVWNWWLARRQVLKVGIRRDVPEFVFAGTPFEWTIVVANPARAAAGHLAVTEPAVGTTWFLDGVPPGGAVAVTGVATLPTRGVHVWREARVTSGHPVGLARVVRSVDLPLEVLVAPRLGRLQRAVLRAWLNQHCPTRGQVRASAHRQPTAQLEFHGLRSFRPGDSPRHIHWRTTARRGELMVREFEDLPNDNLMLIVDPRAPDAVPAGAAALERLLALAATIGWEWCRQKGDQMAFAMVGAPPVCRRGVTGRELAAAMLKELALCRGDPAMAWPPLLQRLEQLPSPDAAVLVLTLRPDVPLAELTGILRRPAACVNVAMGEEQAFFAEIV